MRPHELGLTHGGIWENWGARSPPNRACCLWDRRGQWLWPCSLTLTCCLSVHFVLGCQMLDFSTPSFSLFTKAKELNGGLCCWEELLGCQLLRPPCRGTSGGNQGRPCSPALAQDLSPQGQGGLGDEEGKLSFPQVPGLQSTSALHPSRCQVPSGWSTQEVPHVPADACGSAPPWSRRTCLLSGAGTSSLDPQGRQAG